MKKSFYKVDPYKLNKNTFDLIGNKWFLLTAGNLLQFNIMTASWGGMGILWNKPVVFVFVRPTRFTYSFMNSQKQFSLCFFTEEHREILNFCGSNSGKDVDKIKATGLTPIESEAGTVYFAQSELVINCEKLYHNDLDPKNFTDQEINKSYPLKDYHRMFIGEIISCCRKSPSGSD
jgi:flavin reductase (DIM6/NTAB) family NADH-FMN oxidoreductase RutF